MAYLCQKFGQSPGRWIGLLDDVVMRAFDCAAAMAILQAETPKKSDDEDDERGVYDAETGMTTVRGPRVKLSEFMKGGDVTIQLLQPGG